MKTTLQHFSNPLDSKVEEKDHDLQVDCVKFCVTSFLLQRTVFSMKSSGNC
jgi:hypothetical protein